MKAVIIAGGFGTRMRPLTYTTPKPILPICNKPFLLHQIELLKKHGITEVILCLQYLSESIKQIIEQEEKKIGLKVHYTMEDEPLGTAGAIKNAEQYFDDDPLIVCNGDILTDLDITALLANHREKQAEVSIAVTEVEDPTAFGLIISDEDGYIQKFLEKPTLEEASSHGIDRYFINAGTYVINPHVFTEVPTGRAVSIERETFPGLLKNNYKLCAFQGDAYWLDLGTPAKYLQAHQDILLDKVRINGEGVRDGSIISGSGTILNSSINITGFISLGSNVEVGDDSFIEDSVVLDNVIIGKKTKITSAIIGNNCIIEDGAVVPPGTVLGDNERITRVPVENTPHGRVVLPIVLSDKNVET
ncbi:MAG: NDP-sugar synthase [Candidatus Margulisiibacteriota bacterium]